MGNKIDYDYRLPEDRLGGKGYMIRCNSCGMNTLSSHDRYCPFCGPDTVTPFTAEQLAPPEYVCVTYSVSGRFVARIPVSAVVPAAGEDALREYERIAEEMYDSADFGELKDAEGEIAAITGPRGENLLDRTGR